MQHPSDINPTIAQVAHTAATYLHRLAKTGIPAPSLSAPWSKQHLHQVYWRGAHSSALHKFQDFLLDNMLDMVRKKYWVVLPFHTVKHLPNLKLAPAGVVPQRTRRPRPIIDYTFTGVNQSSAPLAPMNAMQFGSTIHRTLQHIAYSNPKFGPVLMSKIDLLDGYYRVPLSPSVALELAVVLPPLKRKGNKPLIGIPLVLPMGWKYSPPFFCAYTETATDLVNSTINLRTPLTPHTLEQTINAISVPVAPPSEQALYPHQAYLATQPISYSDVYMDDFIGLSQPPTSITMQRAMLHSIDAVFRGHALPGDAPTRTAVISTKKLAAGDGTWSTQKVILGWLLDTADMTLRLPTHKAQHLIDIIQAFLPLQRTSRRKWQCLLGRLRHLAVAIPGARYLFSIIQNILVEQPAASRLCLNPLVTASLKIGNYWPRHSLTLRRQLYRSLLTHHPFLVL
jgi:hypothetical protein